MPLERPDHYGHLIGKTHTGKLAAAVSEELERADRLDLPDTRRAALAASAKERWNDCPGGALHNMTLKPDTYVNCSIIRDPEREYAKGPFRGGYAELDRRLSPRFPTTAEAQRRRRQRQRAFGSALISLAGCGIALGLSGLPYIRVVGYAIGAVVFCAGIVFAVIDYATRERKAP